MSTGERDEGTGEGENESTSSVLEDTEALARGGRTSSWRSSDQEDALSSVVGIPAARISRYVAGRMAGGVGSEAEVAVEAGPHGRRSE